MEGGRGARGEDKRKGDVMLVLRKAKEKSPTVRRNIRIRIGGW